MTVHDAQPRESTRCDGSHEARFAAALEQARAGAAELEVPHDLARPPSTATMRAAAWVLSCPRRTKPAARLERLIIEGLLATGERFEQHGARPQPNAVRKVLESAFNSIHALERSGKSETDVLSDSADLAAARAAAGECSTRTERLFAALALANMRRTGREPTPERLAKEMADLAAALTFEPDTLSGCEVCDVPVIPAADVRSVFRHTRTAALFLAVSRDDAPDPGNPKHWQAIAVPEPSPQLDELRRWWCDVADLAPGAERRFDPTRPLS